MKLFRSSGEPIDTRHKKAQEEALNRAMDKLESEIGKCTQENASLFQKALTSVHNDLLKRFPICVNIKYPRNKSDMNALCKKFGSIAFCVEDTKMVAYILDK